jgi:hypothetical protein
MAKFEYTIIRDGKQQLFTIYYPSDFESKAVYTVIPAGGDKPFTLIKQDNSDWICGSPNYDQKTIDQLILKIEEQETDHSNDYDQEQELKNMFPDSDSLEGFDWTLKK